MAANNADNVDALRRLTAARIEDVYSCLVNNDSVDVDDVLEDIEQIFEALYSLDSVVRLSEDIFRDILAAKRILENISRSHSRTPRIFSGIPDDHYMI